MSFKDLLDKYNSGHASEEEIKLIEEELDKHEAIEDYLSESYNVGLEKDSLQIDTNNETTFIKRSVNRRLRKVILFSVSIVFLILFATHFIVSPIISSLYYNPAQKTVSKYHGDLYFDLKVFTELNLPGYAINTAGAEALGFGEYNVYFVRSNLFNRESDQINAKINKNLRNGSLQDFFPYSYFGFIDIIQPDPIRDGYAEMQNKEVINHIQALNPVSYVSANILFKQDLSVEEFNELRTKYDGKINFKWVGIRTGSEGKPIDYLSGFNPNLNDGSTSGDSADKEKYPYLQLADVFRNRDNRTRSISIMIEAYTKHFTSLLRYMNDREEAVRTLDYNPLKVDYYRNALNYVEKNGVNTYGALVYGEAGALLEFINNEKAKTIEINSVLPSKYINNITM